MPYIGTAPSSELANLDINGQKFILDADADTSITADTDDQIDIEIAGADDFRITANSFNVLSGSTLTIDSGATITNSGTANNFGVALANDGNNRVVTGTGSGGLNGEANLSFDGSTLAVTGAISGTTLTGSGVLSIDDTTDSTSGTSGSIHTDGGLGIAKDLVVVGDINAADGAEGTPSITFTSDTNTGFWRPGADEIRWSLGANAMGCLTTTQLTFGETGNNTQMTRGITISQSTADDEILALKSYDVAHGITDQCETDTYGFIRKTNPTQGGIDMHGFSTHYYGFQLHGCVGYESTTHSTSGTAAVTVHGEGQSGTDKANIGATANCLGVLGNGGFRWTVDAGGNTYYDGSSNASNWDEHDDIALLDAFRHVTMTNKDQATKVFGNFIEENAQILHDSGVIEMNDDGHHFVSTKGLNGLLIDSIRQTNARMKTIINAVEEMVPGFADKLNERLESQSLPALSI